VTLLKAFKSIIYVLYWCRLLDHTVVGQLMGGMINSVMQMCVSYSHSLVLCTSKYVDVAFCLLRLDSMTFLELHFMFLVNF